MKNQNFSNKINVNETVEKITYDKKWLSFEEQYELLKSRGMSFENYPKEKALNKLEFIGYYRLSGYSYAFRKSATDDNFIEGTDFRDIIELYKFDRKLKLLLLDAIERIEIALRGCIAYCLTKKSVSYLDDDSQFDRNRIVTIPSNRKKSINEVNITVGELVEKLKKSITKKINQKAPAEPSIEHLISKYKEPYPLWIVIHVLDLSDLCDLYQIIDKETAKKISIKFGVENAKVFTSWIQTIRSVRNICAHHSRLVDKKLKRLPSIPKSKNSFPWTALWTEENIDSTKIFPLICIIHHMLNAIKASNSWDERMTAQIKQFPNIGIEKMNSAEKVLNCPKGWEEYLRKQG